MNGNGTAEKEDRNSLSAAQMFTAAKHLEAEREAILEKRPTLEELAKLLSDRTGFKLTACNAKGIKTMTGISWKPKIVRASGGAKRRQDNKQLAAAILQLAAAYGETLRNQAEIEKIANRD